MKQLYTLLQSYKSIPPFTRGDRVHIIGYGSHGYVVIVHAVSPKGNICIKKENLRIEGI